MVTRFLAVIQREAGPVLGKANLFSRNFLKEIISPDETKAQSWMGAGWKRGYLCQISFWLVEKNSGAQSFPGV